MTLSLCGKNRLNPHNLLGKNNYNQNLNNFSNIKKIKDKIIKNYLIPLFSKQWTELIENLFLIDTIYTKLNDYYKIYKIDELLTYIDLIDVLKLLVEKHKLLEETSNSNFSNFSNSNSSKSKNELLSLVFKTTSIKLLPEYELYDSILGKPKKELKQKYNELIIHDIQTLIKKEI